MGSSSHWGLIMVPDQESNSDSFDFLHNNCKLSENPWFVFLSYRKNFVGLKNEFELAVVNEPSVFELLRFDCIWNKGLIFITPHFHTHPALPQAAFLSNKRNIGHDIRPNKTPTLPNYIKPLPYLTFLVKPSIFFMCFIKKKKKKKKVVLG